MIEPLALWAPAYRLLAGALLGSIAGSFLATLVVRWPAGRSIVTGRSACDACGAPLGASALIPIVSFVVRHGRCGTCGSPINWRHPALELAAAAIGALSLLAYPGWAGLTGAVFGWTLLTLGALDLEHMWLPDRLTLPLLALGLAIGIAGLPPASSDRLIGAAAAYFGLTAIALLYRTTRGRIGMGGGDPKLFAAIGAWLGWHALPLILLGASVAGLLVAAIMHRMGRPIDRATAQPFGAFLAFAGWIGWLAGAGL